MFFKTSFDPCFEFDNKYRFNRYPYKAKSLGIMEYVVTDPATKLPVKFRAKPEQLYGEQGYRIICENGPSFFISNKYGGWRLVDNCHVDSELLERIGQAIEE